MAKNIARNGFYINGFINHYADIIIMIDSGKIVLVETKGGHIINDDGCEKIELGNVWRNTAENNTDTTWYFVMVKPYYLMH